RVPGAERARARLQPRLRRARRPGGRATRLLSLAGEGPQVRPRVRHAGQPGLAARGVVPRRAARPHPVGEERGGRERDRAQARIDAPALRAARSRRRGQAAGAPGLPRAVSLGRPALLPGPRPLAPRRRARGPLRGDRRALPRLRARAARRPRGRSMRERTARRPAARLPPLSIRRGTRRDAPVILRLIRGLAEYERLAHEAVATASQIPRHGFGPRRYFETIICHRGRKPLAFALYLF